MVSREEHQQIGNLMQKLVRTLHMFEKGKLTRRGFTFTQCYTLLTVKGKGPIAMNELSAEMNLDASTMSRVVATLARNGLVLRSRDNQDRRVVQVSLTPEGRRAAEEIDAAVQEFYSYIIRELPDEQVKNVIGTLDLLLKTFARVRPFCC